MNSLKTTWSLFAALLLIVNGSFLYSVQASAKNSNSTGEAFNDEAVASHLYGGTDTDGDGISDKKDKCPDTPKAVPVDKTGCPLDADKDGVKDYLDKCPRTIGTASMNGCPDTDKDGISDFDDTCPDVPGIARFTGCPDSDGDGVEDSKDKCPNAKGLDRFKGCPDTDGDGVEDGLDKCPGSEMGIIVNATGCSADQDRDGIIDTDDKCPDTEKGIKVDARGCPSDVDGDGIVDSKDKCPTTKGEGTVNGCPMVKVVVVKRLQTIARGINFETNKADLKAASYPMLDEIVSILNEYPDYDLKMGGHTDNVGDDNYNMDLSQSRMDGVKSYLAGKGVPPERINATGYGETKPVATNNTAEGRMQNRRVELELVLNDRAQIL